MSDDPIACALTTGAYADRLSLIQRVGREALEGLEQHPGHTELRFRRDPRMARDLGAIRDAEAECCPFLRLTLHEQPDAIVLSIASARLDGAFMVDELARAFAAGRPDVAIEHRAGMTADHRAPYRKRPVRFLCEVEADGWFVKVYGISAAGQRPPRELVGTAVERARLELPPAAAEAASGYGWLIVHEATDLNFVLLDWVAGGNEIHQRLLSGPLGRPEELDTHPTPAIGCVWELAVTDFERRAWLRHVLANPEGPDLDRYRQERLNADV